MLGLVISVVLILRIKYLRMPGCHPLLINPDNWITAMLTWKSAGPDIFGMPFIMPQNMFVIGMDPLEHIWKRNVLKESITMLRYPMLLKNLYG